MVDLLVNSGININIQDFDTEMTALMYITTLNNNQIATFLLQKSDPNIQDFMGNTFIHYTIMEDNQELLNIIMENKIKIITNLNIHNIQGKLPIHLILEKNIIDFPDNILEFFIINSNLNIQDSTGNTPFLYITQNLLWKKFKNILNKKKLNIFIRNKNNYSPLDFVENSDKPDFLDLLITSYLYILRNNNFIWANKWENLCSKDIKISWTPAELKILNKYTKNKNLENICYDLIKKKLTGLIKKKSFQSCEPSYPVKLNKPCIKFEDQPVEYCSFIGITMDILFGLIYLLSKFEFACSTLTTNFIINKDLCNYYKNIGIITSTRCEFLNFEIVWIYKKLFLSENFADNFKNCLDNSKIRFIIIPLGIELKEGSHANYLIFDKKINQMERFEPYGSHSPYKFNYNQELLDSVLAFRFSEIFKDIKYIPPTQYLPKISFQYFEAMESKTQKIGDPSGFCAIWSIWYTDQRLTYPDINRASLVKKLLKEIKIRNFPFKNIVRNYSANITNIRDKIFEKIKITINDWINDQYSESQYLQIISEIKNLLITGLNINQ